MCVVFRYVNIQPIYDLLQCFSVSVREGFMFEKGVLSQYADDLSFEMCVLRALSHLAVTSIMVMDPDVNSFHLFRIMSLR